MFQRFIVITCAASLVLTGGCGKKSELPAKPETLLRLSFLGSAAAFQQTNFAFLQRVAAMPSSKRLFEQTRARLALAAAADWGAGTNAAVLLHPVIDDLATHRSFVEVKALPGGAPEWLVAAEIPDGRAATWRSNLSAILPAAPATTAPSTPGVAIDPLLSKNGTRFQLVRAGGWSLLASGGAANEPLNAALKSLGAGKSLADLPPGALLKAETQAGAANDRLHWLPRAAWPTIEMVVSGRNQRLRSDERWTFPTPTIAGLGAWHVPAETIHDDPLIAFTAGRGLAPLLKQIPLFGELQIGDSLDEFYFWCQAANPPIMEYMALRTANASNTVNRIASTLPDFLSRHFTNRTSGEVRWATNRSGLVWEGLPAVLPFARALAEPAGQFVVAGLWPIMPSKTTIPKELTDQFVPKTNVVYYHWESTPERIRHARPVGQLIGYALTPYSSTATTSTADAWLDDIGPLLDKTVIEATAVSDRELRVVRNSRLGIGAEGLVRLAQWLDHWEFPHTAPSFVFEPAPAMRRKTAPPAAAEAKKP